MGNENSAPANPDGPPQTLKARTLDALADHIKSGKVKDIVLMVHTILFNFLIRFDLTSNPQNTPQQSTHTTVLQADLS